jgi:hypothetical protein
MKQAKRGIHLLYVLVLAATGVQAQDPDGFDLEAYRMFLNTHKDLTEQQLLVLHPAGVFNAKATTTVQGTAYFSRIDSVYHFTPYELELLGRHGFVVSERLQRSRMDSAYLEAYHRDLPVVVTTDAILHALHKSYDALLQRMEYSVLLHTLDTMLTRMHDGIPGLATRYASVPGMRVPLRDADLYLAVARQLLGNGGTPIFAENAPRVAVALQAIAAETDATVPLFADWDRTVDFSQFRPRGHYADDPTLARYFKAMMWLGRIEIYYKAPVGDLNSTPDSVVQKQAVTGLLLCESAQVNGALPFFERIERILRFFVGDQDNISLSQLCAFVTGQGISSADQLLPVAAWEAFQQRLLQQSYASQRIISQLLWSDPMSPVQIVPASAFMLVGQRFIVDSYVTGGVVFDRIIYNGEKILRMLPSTLDVLFALGNDAAGQLLTPALAQYHYASNLAGLRYLVDSYDSTYWNSTIYNGWLNSLRALNPPADRGALPPFMQTAAWWQQKMNTQLSGWAQLRHDNLLYAKESYTGIPICSFPESYVEPIPAFYDAMKALAQSARAFFANSENGAAWDLRTYFQQFESIMDTLGTIARKELSSVMLTEAEKGFLRSMMYYGSLGCTTGVMGWYPNLYYSTMSDYHAVTMTVADIHTTPADEWGNRVGWVVHAGTGPINMATFIVTLPDGQRIAAVGPMLSYYEYVSTNFKRLTDEEWQTQYNVAPAFRPDFVNLYLADATGSARGAGSTLETRDPDAVASTLGRPVVFSLLQNHPNPFNSTTIIPFTVSTPSTGQHVQLRVYDVQGQLVRTLLDEALPGGNYAVRWEGTNDRGTAVATGIYFYTLRSDMRFETRKLVVLR